jgi:hypothetical protein
MESVADLMSTDGVATKSTVNVATHCGTNKNVLDNLLWAESVL